MSDMTALLTRLESYAQNAAALGDSRAKRDAAHARKLIDQLQAGAADFGIEDIEDDSPYASPRARVVDFSTGVQIGYPDGGEPEDASLYRDWSWVPQELQAAYDRGRLQAIADAESAN